ncbi:MAG: glycosyltransferase [bacterium]|nr:glycosyltransferase [bacterium]
MSEPQSKYRPIALTYMVHYLPGFQAGGAMRTLLNMVEAIGDDVEFRIVTKDRDFLATEPYPDVPPGEWVRVGKAHVLYVAPENLSSNYFAELARTTPHDLVYCPSFFDPRFTLLPLLLHWLGRTPQVPVVVAPQNELSPGALSLKALKKRTFLTLAKLLGFHRGVVFHASSELEREEIRVVFPRSPIVIARNLLHPPDDSGEKSSAPKEAGKLRVVFLSRISAKKNLSSAIRFLCDPELRGDIQFDIFGPIDDPNHWAECQSLLEELPAHLHVNVRGPIENDRIGEVLPDYHLFILPTLGESFGYAILEAMLWGCPALISDRTPWEDLEEHGAGWTLPLEEPSRYREAIQACLDAGPEEQLERVEATKSYARRSLEESGAVEENLNLLLDLLPDAPTPRGR